MPMAIANYLDIEQEIEALKLERRAIIKNLERLPPIEYELLHKSYIQDYTLYEIADYFGKSYEWAKKKKRTALNLLQEIIDELQPAACEVCPCALFAAFVGICEG
jgi:DNA-directed RNA polymerase specialized sigma24 family protein